MSQNLKLKKLDVSYNNPLGSTLDLSNNTQLQTINVGKCGLSNLTLPASTTLTSLSAYDNNLTSINVSNCPNLEKIGLAGNKLSSIDVTKNTKLTELDVEGNTDITNLDLSKNLGLKTLYVTQTGMSSLDVSHLPQLERLLASETQISSINLTSNPQLKELYMTNAKLTQIDISQCPELVRLDVEGNKLTSINLEANSNLKYLKINNNQLTKLSVPNKQSLSYIKADNNQLTEVNVSGCTNLKEFYVTHNQLQALDVSSNTQLEKLWANYNQLTSLDLSSNPNCDAGTGNQERTIMTNSRGQIPYSLLGPDFDRERATYLNGAHSKEDHLKVWEGCDEVTYSYDTKRPGAAEDVKYLRATIHVQRPVTYDVTVTDGTSEFTNYAEGENVNLTADTIEHKKFVNWTSEDGVTFADPTAESTSFAMPAKPVSVQANYVDLLYQVTVNNGTGSGAYVKGATVNLEADPAPIGQIFVNWTNDSGLSLEEETNPITSFIMVGKDVILQANYKDALLLVEPFQPDPWTKGTETGMTATVNGDAASLQKLTVADKELVKGTDYTVKSGSSIITLLPGYLNGLEAGTYEVSLDYAEGETVGAGTLKSEFSIKNAPKPVDSGDSGKADKVGKPGSIIKVASDKDDDKTPKTGDSQETMLWGLLLVISGAGLTCGVFRGRRKYPNR